MVIVWIRSEAVPEKQVETAIFLIDRQLYYKFLSPVINEVLSRGMRVLCLHSYQNDKSRFSGIKADQFAYLATCPQFSEGNPELVVWRKHEDITALITGEGVRYIYALYGPRFYGLDGSSECNEVIWIQLQHGADSFLDVTNTDEANIFASYSKIWLEHFSRADSLNSKNVGCPALTSVEYDPIKIRRKYTLPPQQAIIVYFAGDHPRLMGVLGILNSLWYRYVFSDDSWLGCLQIVARLLSKVTATEIALVKALRSYAIEKGALFVIKSRSKRKLSPLMCNYADVVCYDESLYPSTNYELMKIASLVVCIASSAQLEAAYFGAPSISVYPDPFKNQFMSSLDRVFPNYPSRYVRSISEFIGNLRSGNLHLPEISAAEVVELFGSHHDSARLLVDLAMCEALQAESRPNMETVSHAK
jgi:hypothetical protein